MASKRTKPTLLRRLSDTSAKLLQRLRLSRKDSGYDSDDQAASGSDAGEINIDEDADAASSDFEEDEAVSSSVGDEDETVARRIGCEGEAAVASSVCDDDNQSVEMPEDGQSMSNEERHDTSIVFALLTEWTIVKNLLESGAVAGQEAEEEEEELDDDSDEEHSQSFHLPMRAKWRSWWKDDPLEDSDYYDGMLEQRRRRRIHQEWIQRCPARHSYQSSGGRTSCWNG